jgi:malonyl CoA-acyl carrier protein transacylase
MRRRVDRDLALVGMACRFAGAPDLFAFCRDVLTNRDSMRDGSRNRPVNDGKVEPSSLSDVLQAALDDATIDLEQATMGRVETVIATTSELNRKDLGRFQPGRIVIVAGYDASSGAALELGRCALFECRADIAVVGGVHVEADVDEIAVVVLKRLRDAERSGDRVYAVLDGASFAVAARCPAGLSAGARNGRGGPAAELLALIRAALALHHRLLLPHKNGTRPGRRLAGDVSKVVAAARPWIHGDARMPRRARIRTFGRAGASARVVLNEHAASADGISPGALLEWDTEAFLLAGEDRTALAQRVQWLCGRLTRNARHSLKDLAFTLNSQSQESSGGARVGIVASSQDELVEMLGAIADRLSDPACRQVRDSRGLYFWAEPLGRDGSLAFLFPGEGSQYPGMLADLCPHFPELRAVLDTADRIARESGADVPPSAHLFGDSHAVDAQGLWATDTAVTAVLSSQWAIFQVLQRLGLQPDAVVGHSSGELPALAAAGVLPTEQTLEHQLSRLAAIFRDLEAAEAIPRARLVAAGTDRARAEAACRLAGPSVVVAIDNCPHQVVLAGPPGEVEAVVSRLRAGGVLCEDLPFERAYHTAQFAAVLAPLAAFYGDLELHPARVPIYSCCTASRMPRSVRETRELAVAQWTRPVAFRETIQAMHDDGLRIFVDVGARGNLAGYVEDILRGRPSFAVAANLPRRSGTAQLNHLVASLFAQGIVLDPAYLYARRRPKRIDVEAPRAPVAETFERLPNFDPRPSENGNGHVGSDRQERPPALKTALCSLEEIVPRHPLEEPAGRDEAMLAYLAIMNDFLETQRQVMEAFLRGEADEFAGGRTGVPRQRPWLGTILEYEAGKRMTARLSLDGDGDPVAENHTLGGRRVSAIDPRLKGLPVLPFSVMVEIVAQAASLLVPAGMVLVSLHELRAHRWVPFGRDGGLEISAQADSADPCRVRVTLYQSRGEKPYGSPSDSLVFEGIAQFAERRPEPVAAAPLEIADARPSKFTAQRLYREQWLFHGPPMQALTAVGPVSRAGITGTITVRPLPPLLRPGESMEFLTDPIALDTFTHLLGCWGLDCLEQGDVIFPLGMGTLTIYGSTPEVGTEIDCPIKVNVIEHHRVSVAAEMVRPDGRIWMRIDDWEDWRFYWPARYRDVFRAPDAVLVGEKLPLPGVPDADAVAVWLEPPGDMARPVWRDVLEQTQLGPDERHELLADAGTESNRTRGLWCRIAAKEAARRLWLAAGLAARFPADLRIDTGETARPRLRDLAREETYDLPALSIAEAEGVVVALAARDPGTRLGTGVEPISGFDEGSEVQTTLRPEELSLIPVRAGLPRAGWLARVRAARQTAASAIGLGQDAAPDVEVESVDLESGDVIVTCRPASPSASVWPAGTAIRVHTAVRANHAWSWTLGEEIQLSCA